MGDGIQNVSLLKCYGRYKNMSQKRYFLFYRELPFSPERGFPQQGQVCSVKFTRT